MFYESTFYKSTFYNSMLYKSTFYKSMFFKSNPLHSTPLHSIFYDMPVSEAGLALVPLTAPTGRSGAGVGGVEWRSDQGKRHPFTKVITGFAFHNPL